MLMPPILNTADTGNDRDILFSQTMDLIPVSPVIWFLEPGSSTVWFYISGYVVGTSATSAAAAEEAGVPLVEESVKSP